MSAAVERLLEPEKTPSGPNPAHLVYGQECHFSVTAQQ